MHSFVFLFYTSKVCTQVIALLSTTYYANENKDIRGMDNSLWHDDMDIMM